MSTLTTDTSDKNVRNVKVADLILGRVELIQLSDLSAEEIYEVVVGAIKIARPYFKYLNIFVDFAWLVKDRLISETAIRQFKNLATDDALYKSQCIELFPLSGSEYTLKLQNTETKYSRLQWESQILYLSKKGEFLKWTFEKQTWTDPESLKVSEAINNSSLELASRDELLKILPEKWNRFFRTLLRQMRLGVEEKRRRWKELDEITNRVSSIWKMVKTERR